MKNLKLSQEERAALARSIAELIIGAMADTQTSFEVLADRLEIPVDELRSVIYGNEKDITIGQITLILHAMGITSKLSVSLTPPEVKSNHLKLVSSNTTDI